MNHSELTEISLKLLFDQIKSVNLVYDKKKYDLNCINEKEKILKNHLFLIN